MEILLALIFGAACGGVLHFVQPGRGSRGAALAPMLGAVLGAVPWLVLTWMGFTTASPALWLVSFLLPVVVVPLVLEALRRSRASHDERERARLGIA